MKLVLLEGTAISLVSSVLGAVVGSVAALVLSSSFAGLEAPSLDPWFVAVSVVLSIIMGTLPTIYSARKASQLDPATALRAI